MPKRIVPLTSLQITNAKPRDKEYKLSDGGGLYLLITPSGGKLWRMKYRFGARKSSYPLVPSHKKHSPMLDRKKNKPRN
jgi:hypothetical protein